MLHNDRLFISRQGKGNHFANCHDGEKGGGRERESLSPHLERMKIFLSVMAYRKNRQGKVIFSEGARLVCVCMAQLTETYAPSPSSSSSTYQTRRAIVHVSRPPFPRRINISFAESVNNHKLSFVISWRHSPASSPFFRSAIKVAQANKSIGKGTLLLARRRTIKNPQ